MYSIYITETRDKLDSGIVFPHHKLKIWGLPCSKVRFSKPVLHGHQGAQMYRVRDERIILMDHRIQQTGLHLQMFIYYKYTKRQTNLWKWSYLQRQVLEVRGGLGRHAVLVLVLWWRWSWWRLDRRCLVGRLWGTKINVRDSSVPGFLDILINTNNRLLQVSSDSSPQ